MKVGVFLNQSYNIEKTGNEIATRFLKQKGYIVLKQKFLCRFGISYIVAKKGEKLIFIKVRTISNSLPNNRVAKLNLSIKDCKNNCARFDMIEVYVDKGFARVKHIPQII